MSIVAAESGAEFAILGPLEILFGGRHLHLGSGREQRVLAALLLEVGRQVPIGRLVEIVWDDEPPPTAEKAVRNSVSALRSRLAGAAAGTGGANDLIVTRSAGYLLRIEPERLDLRRFESGVAEARRYVAQGAPGPAVEAFTAALNLWRGPALAGVGGRLIQAAAARLDEQRLVVQEEYLALRLALGDDPGLIDELAGLVADHPLRERLRGLHMLALARGGRRSAALEVYRQGREILVAELGIEPGAELARLHRALLAGEEPVIGTPPPAGATTVPNRTDTVRPSPERERRPEPRIPVPAQLPTDPVPFVGRAGQLRLLDELAASSTVPGAAGVAIALVTGTAGVGKTALVVHWAHRARDRFPDGQLYVDLHGYAVGARVRPLAALHGFLLALGLAADRLPLDVATAGAMYRSLLADRRALVVLDNAAHPEQVRPLLPAGPGTAVVITSRHRLSGLAAREGARAVPLDVLSADEVRDLLGRILGERPVRAEPEAVTTLAGECAHLPLALRIAAENVVTMAGGSIARYVDALRSRGLAALEIEGDELAAVRGTFDLSYTTLPTEARRLFRLTGMVPGADLTVEAGAALTAASVAESTRVMNLLVAAHLVRGTPAGRYSCHDLLRRYAADLTEQHDDPAERAAALDRLHDWYLRGVDAAARVLYPQMLRLPLPTPVTGVCPPAFTGPPAALAWLDAERANLVAVVTGAATAGAPSAAWRIADALRGYLHLRRPLLDWLAVAEAAVAAADAEGGPLAMAGALLNIADAYQRQSRYPRATAYYRQALTLSREADWPDGTAVILGNLGFTFWQTGELRAAAEHLTDALVVGGATGRPAGAAVVLGNLGAVYRELGKPNEAVEHQRQALALHRRSGSRMGEATALGNLGETCHALGRPEEALGHLRRALALHRESGDRGGEAEAHRILAAVHRDAGRPDQALSYARTAHDAARGLGDRRLTAATLNTLATVEERLGDLESAARHHRAALDTAREINARYQEAEALLGLAVTYAGLRRTAEAVDCGERCLRLAQRAGYRTIEDRVLAVLGLCDNG